MEKLELTDHETIIACDLLLPDMINVSFEDIAGLDHIIDELKYQVIFPLSSPEVFNSGLRQPPKGVLFHGPPGCGKTMLAKAIAKEAGVRFLNLSVAMLTDKWYGESQKLAHAVFSLAFKIQPCIIFMDEIDSFLRSRASHDHEATAMMKAQFMAQWDGLLTSANSRVVLIGATNRPNDIDKAVLRRMPVVFEIGLPSREERKKILELTLKKEKLNPDVDYEKLGESTAGFSGSDLADLCRGAAYQSIRELSQVELSKLKDNLNVKQNDKKDKLVLRPISMSDLVAAIDRVKTSGRESRYYLD